ncbi:MAG: permease [Endozoicomonas sp.]
MNAELTMKADQALEMFLFLATELTLLFLLISFVIGIILDFMSAKRIQSILGSKGGKGYISAGLLGALTPFCSCSTIPMLSGLLKGRAGFGPTITFLFTSPLMNPIIVGLFLATFGLKVTVVYLAIALVVSVLGGYVLEKLGFERYVRQEYVHGESTAGCGQSSGCGDSQPASGCGGVETASSSCSSEPVSACGDEKTASGCGSSSPVSNNRWSRIWAETWKQFKKLFPILMLGVGIGSLTYGFVPENFIAQYAGSDNLLAIPFAAVIGVPLYIRAEAMIPLASALATKGMGMGALMALIIGSAGASLTEVILLKSMFRNQMIAAFLLVIFTMAVSAGVIFTLI